LGWASVLSLGGWPPRSTPSLSNQGAGPHAVTSYAQPLSSSTSCRARERERERGPADSEPVDHRHLRCSASRCMGPDGTSLQPSCDCGRSALPSRISNLKQRQGRGRKGDWFVACFYPKAAFLQAAWPRYFAFRMFRACRAFAASRVRTHVRSEGIRSAPEREAASGPGGLPGPQDEQAINR
jgi:hypothetical protein